VELNRAKADTQEGWDYEYASIELGIERSLADQLTRLIKTAKTWLEVTPEGKSGKPPVGLIGCLIAAYQKAAKHNPGLDRAPPLAFFRACRDQFDLPLPRQDASLRRALARHRARDKIPDK
jgi:hypothetical protein